MSVGFESILNSIYEVAQCPVLFIDRKGDVIFKKRPYGRLTSHVERDLYAGNSQQVSSNHCKVNCNVGKNSSDEFLDMNICATKQITNINDLNSNQDGNTSQDNNSKDFTALSATSRFSASNNISMAATPKEISCPHAAIDNAADNASDCAIDNASDCAIDDASANDIDPKLIQNTDYAEESYLELSEDVFKQEVEYLRKFSIPVHLTHRKNYGGYCLPDDSILIVGPLDKSKNTHKEYQIRITAVNALLDAFCFIAKRLVSSNQSVDTSFSNELSDVLEELKDVKDITPDWLDVVMVEHPHHSYASELVKLDAVASGDPERYEEESAKSTDGINGTLAYTRLRDLQNLGICNVVLCSRAAISSGLSVEMAYTMADYIILTIERCRSEKEIIYVSHKAGLIFARMVRGLKKDDSYKSSMRRLSRKALETIRRHLYLKTDRKTIASQLKVNEDYLDRALKADLNLTVSECLRVERIKEAKKLLIGTETPIFEIAQLLMFTSSSHFARVFKRVTGITPNEYRDKKQNSNPYHL